MREPDVQGILVEFAVPPDPVDLKSTGRWSTLDENKDWDMELTMTLMFLVIKISKITTMQFLLQIFITFMLFFSNTETCQKCA